MKRKTSKAIPTMEGVLIKPQGGGAELDAPIPKYPRRTNIDTPELRQWADAYSEWLEWAKANKWEYGHPAEAWIAACRWMQQQQEQQQKGS